MAIHAARHHGAQVVGIALSREQVDEGDGRVPRAGLEDRIEIRFQDYRDLRGEQFDAISSIGMFEHVGRSPDGPLLRHAPRAAGTDRAPAQPRHLLARRSRLGRRTFIGRYVFPDGELIDVGRGGAGHGAGRVRGPRRRVAARALRPHPALLGGQPRGPLGRGGGPRRTGRGPTSGGCTWPASAIGFDDGGIAVHQVLGVVPGADGSSGMPRTRLGLGLTTGTASSSGSLTVDCPSVEGPVAYLTVSSRR